MLNFEVAPELLQPRLPAGTELDFWNDKTYVSLVGFLFAQTRLFKIPIPFHRNFEEVNLRFYVRRQTAGGWRRGVVFIKEIVPRRVIAWTARTVYHENYLALPMSHRLEMRDQNVRSVSYAWRFAGRKNSLTLSTGGTAQPMVAGSEAEFIAEHYWGYSRQPNGATLEYQVEHPPWLVQPAAAATLDCAATELYGPNFAETLSRPATSAFLAAGSPVIVRKGVRLP